MMARYLDAQKPKEPKYRHFEGADGDGAAQVIEAYLQRSGVAPASTRAKLVSALLVRRPKSMTL